jgi:putative flippase GtrA
MGEHGLTTLAAARDGYAGGRFPSSLFVTLPKRFVCPGIARRAAWLHGRRVTTDQQATVGDCSGMSEIRNAPEVFRRLVSRNVGAMLARNTVVGTIVFALDLLLLWTLVAAFGMPKLAAATVGFVVSTSLHYLVGRCWIFKGATRHLVSGYFYFLVSGGVGLAITLLMFAALTSWTTINYLVARVIVSLFAGLASFLLNAVFTFQRV